MPILGSHDEAVTTVQGEEIPCPVELHRVHLRAPAAEVERRWHELDPQEQQRADAFVRPGLRERYVVAHSALRHLLGLAVDRPPASLRFERGPHGKPTLTDAALGFNLSHAGDWALVALGRVAELGVDIERVRPIDVMSLARTVFSPAEQRALAARPPDDRQRAFFRTWVRKEAFIKGLGAGLHRTLDSFDVPLDPHEPARLLATRPDPTEADAWALLDIDAPPHHMAALAIARPPGVSWSPPAPPQAFSWPH